MRYTGSDWKRSRRLGFSTLENGKELAKRPYGPGQHGMQFIIVSEKHDEIATQVNEQMERGVTVLYGEGFYSKEKRQVLLILAKKYESRNLFALIRQIDPNAFVSMGNVEGVFGEGFDKIKR